VAGKIKLQLAQYRELAAFAQFGSDLDAKTRAQLDRGARVVEIFKQRLYNPIPMEQQVATLWGIENGFYDAIDTKKIVEASVSFREHVSARNAHLLDKILTQGQIKDDIAAELKSAYEEWSRTFDGS